MRMVYPVVQGQILILAADVAELADALDLGSSGATRAGSIPVIRIDHRKTPGTRVPGVFRFGFQRFGFMDNRC